MSELPRKSLGLVRGLLAAGLLVCFAPVSAEIVAGAVPEHWYEGAEDCAKATQPPLEVQAYEPQTYILRESLCADFEAPFLYLLIGTKRAMLIDTGAVAEADKMPLATTVLKLLPEIDGARMPLLVVHTHGHRDHYAGDVQFASLPAVEVVGPELDAVKKYYGFDQWPEGIAQIELGGRTVDVMPAPGHQEAHVMFYDDRTALLFSGDSLLPARLMVSDLKAYYNSAKRISDLLRDRVVSHVLGGHIEMNTAGELFPGGSQHHPNERSLALGKSDLEGLPAALRDFNGFYSRHASYVITNPRRNLLALAAGVVAVIALIVQGIRRWMRRRRAARA